MASLRGVLVGDSQLKFLSRSRLHLLPSINTCTFSFGGHDALSLANAVSRMGYRRADFAVLYVGGNDLDKSGADPKEICDNIKALVIQLQRDVAPAVFVFKVLPRCSVDVDARSKRRVLNRRLTAALKQMPDVWILNPEHKFLDAAKEPKRFLFAADGYHVSRFRGIDEMAYIIVKALSMKYGRTILLPGRAARRSRYTISWCHRCSSKGHASYDCLDYCSPSRGMARRH